MPGAGADPTRRACRGRFKSASAGCFEPGSECLNAHRRQSARAHQIAREVRCRWPRTGSGAGLVWRTPRPRTAHCGLLHTVGRRSACRGGCRAIHQSPLRALDGLPSTGASMTGACDVLLQSSYIHAGVCRAPWLFAPSDGVGAVFAAFQANYRQTKRNQEQTMGSKKARQPR